MRMLVEDVLVEKEAKNANYGKVNSIEIRLEKGNNRKG